VRDRLWQRGLVVLAILLVLGCVKDGEVVNRYENRIWTNEWVELRKREVALPLEKQRIALALEVPPSLESWKTTIERTIVEDLVMFQRIVDTTNFQALVSVSLLPIRSQVIGGDRKVYEMRGSFRIEMDETVFRSNVVVFDRVYASMSFSEDQVYRFLIDRWARYLCENIHYGWSVSQDFSTIPWLGGTNETDVSLPRSQ